jgi:hypothetical protein
MENSDLSLRSLPNISFIADETTVKFIENNVAEAKENAQFAGHIIRIKSDFEITTNAQGQYIVRISNTQAKRHLSKIAARGVTVVQDGALVTGGVMIIKGVIELISSRGTLGWNTFAAGIAAVATPLFNGFINLLKKTDSNAGAIDANASQGNNSSDPQLHFA